MRTQLRELCCKINEDISRRAHENRPRVLCSKVAEAAPEDEGQNLRWCRHGRSRWQMSCWRDFTEDEASTLESEGLG